METAKAQFTLHDAVIFRALVEREQCDEADGLDVMLLTLLDNVIRDWEFALGRIESPYCDDLQRLVMLKQTLRTMDRILDKIADHSDGEDLPPSAQGLCRILSEMAFQIFNIIRAIESLHPEKQEQFDAERAAYTATRRAEQLG